LKTSVLAFSNIIVIKTPVRDATKMLKARFWVMPCELSFHDLICCKKKENCIYKF